MFVFNKNIALFLVAISTLNAYEFSFLNKTKDSIAIAIHFQGDEGTPAHKQLIKPGARGNFLPGKYNISDIEWGSCLQNIFYAKKPTMKERVNYFAKTKWRKVPITWVPTPLENTRPLKKSSRTKKQEAEKKRIVTKKEKTLKASAKSLCKDRYFEITQDQHGGIVITGSLVE